MSIKDSLKEIRKAIEYIEIINRDDLDLFAPDVNKLKAAIKSINKAFANIELNCK